MELAFKLSEHPFYQMWQKGQITGEQLSSYAYSYSEFIKEMPVFWQMALDGLKVKEKYSDTIISEEKYHTDLWNLFRSKFECSHYPDMTDVTNAFKNLNPSELLGAIHSFEIQQPEIAKTKKEGLLTFYDFTNDETKYFDEHLNEAEHIAFGKMIGHKYADDKDFQNGFSKGSEIIYKALDRFLN